MTQPAPQLPDADAGPWSRLPDLDRRLRAAGFPVGMDRWQNALDLIAALAAHGGLPADPCDLRPLLGPLFCRSPREQQAFAEVFAHWCAASAPVAPPIAPQAPARPPPTPPRQAPPRAPLWRVLVPVSVLVLAAALGLAVWSTPDPAPRGVQRETTPIAGSAVPPAYTGPTGYLEVPLEPFRPRTPPEVLRPSPGARGWLAAADWLLPALPLVAVGVWLAWRRQRLATVLRARRGDPRSPLRDLTLTEADDDLFDGPRVRAALRRLHTPVPVPTRRLDERATCERAARHLGLFLPVYRDQPRVPECVVLVDAHHRGDHLAGLAPSLIRRLRAAGLEVQGYVYQRDPTRVRPAFAPASAGTAAPGPARTLGELAGHHAGARLLIIGDAADLMDLTTDRPAPWTEVLALWPSRGLLATRPVPEPWREALAGAGLGLAPLGAAGLIRLAGDLAADPAAAPGRAAAPPAVAADPGAAALPPRLARAGGPGGGRDPAPAERAALAADIHTWLGPRGRLLLAAVAVYPGLHPGLTRRLDLDLFEDDDAQGRTARLLRLARLPWLRGGSLPHWLRLDLHAATPTAERRRIGGIYLELLRSVVLDGETGIRLPVAVPATGAGAGWRRRIERWLLDLLRGAAPDAALRDRIFVDTVLRPGRLDFRLPVWLARLLPGDPRRWRPAGLLPPLALAVLLGAGVALAWQGGWPPTADAGLRARAAAALLALEDRAHARIAVLEVFHTPDTRALAESLAQALARTGFPAPVLRPLSAPPAAGPGAPAPVNTIQVGDLGDAATAPFIAERLLYLTWGEAPVIADRLADPPPGAPADPPPAGQVRVWLTSNGPGGVITDRLARLLTAAERAAFRDPAGLQLPEPTQTGPRPFETFSDRLAGGGEGPAMIALPGGAFDMGSPDTEPERESNEGPRHRVTLPPFAIGRTEVSFADYDRFATATGRKLPEDQGWGRGERPAINISWEDATAFADWLSRETGKAYRLPTEAEWEYAARAGTAGPFWTGDCIHTDQANYDGNDDYNGCGAKTGVDRGKTLPVASLAANPWGLYDTAGNVWEWTCSAYASPYDGTETTCISKDHASNGPDRVIRGGSWFHRPSGLRSANRFRSAPSYRSDILGFRLAQDF